MTFKPERLNEMREKFDKVQSKLNTNLEEIKQTIAIEKEERK